MKLALQVGDKRSGRVSTPEVVADALCHWAIRSSDDVVLDLGVGEGAFVVAATERLRAVGADGTQLAAQIYGAERDPAVFSQMAARIGPTTILPHVVCANFYDMDLPLVDAVVGNPPYIRRHYQSSERPSHTDLGAGNGSALADEYCHFLLRACSALGPRGRLAVIVSASWLDMRYGQQLKRALLKEFRVRVLLGFDGRVFANALIKPLVMLAEKVPPRGEVTFARLSNNAPLHTLGDVLEHLSAGRPVEAAVINKVAQTDLSVGAPWSAFLKSPEIYSALATQAPLAPMREVAESRIGLQTFARQFYIMTRRDAERLGLEPRYVLPLLFSPKSVRTPVVAHKDEVRHVVFACDEPEERLRGTAAWRYVCDGMIRKVQVRGKEEVVEGFHRAPRLLRAQRHPWYNLRTAIERRGRYPILLPRRVFETYLAIHNLAGVVVNEDFVELRPLSGEKDEAPLLAFLNSSVGEYLVRSHSFQYGGGVYNLNPGEVRNIPIIDPAELFQTDRARLAGAWELFVQGYGTHTSRSELDQTINEVLGITPELAAQVRESLGEFLSLARAAKQTYSPY